MAVAVLARDWSQGRIACVRLKKMKEDVGHLQPRLRHDSIPFDIRMQPVIQMYLQNSKISATRLVPI